MIGEEQQLVDNLDMIWTIAEDCSRGGYEDMNLGLKAVFAEGVVQPVEAHGAVCGRDRPDREREGARHRRGRQRGELRADSGAREQQLEPATGGDGRHSCELLIYKQNLIY